MRQDHRGGEKLFVDYGEGLNLVDPQSGCSIKTELFVAVRGVSNYTFAEATLTNNCPTGEDPIQEPSSYFGCVPESGGARLS